MRTRSPSRSFASGPASAASGVTWIAANTLPDAPDMRPSVSRATRWPRSCRAASVGVSLCSSGIPFARGPWPRTTATKSPANPSFRSSAPTLNAANSASCDSKMRAGASIRRSSGATAEIFTTARPRLPCRQRRPPSLSNGAATPRTTFSSSDVAGAVRQRRLRSSSHGCVACWRRSPPCTQAMSPCSRPASSSSLMTRPSPPAASKWFTSAEPFGYTRASSGVACESSSRSVQSMSTPAARAIATRCSAWLVEPPVAASPTIALTIAFSSMVRPIGR